MACAQFLKRVYHNCRQQTSTAMPTIALIVFGKKNLTNWIMVHILLATIYANNMVFTGAHKDVYLLWAPIQLIMCSKLHRIWQKFHIVNQQQMPVNLLAINERNCNSKCKCIYAFYTLLLLHIFMNYIELVSILSLSKSSLICY